MATLQLRTCTLKIYQPSTSYSGSKATTEIYTFTFPECYMEFRISQIDSDSPNSCYAKIYGISKDTYKLFQDSLFKKYNMKQIVEISIGYDRQEEVIYSGTLARVRYLFNSGQQIMEMLLNQDMEKYRIQRHSFCIQKNTNVYEALDVLCKMYGYTFVCLDEEVFKNTNIVASTFEGTFENCLKIILNKNMKYIIDEQTLIVYSKTIPDKKQYKLLFDNGLITYPALDTNNDEDDVYIIKHKLIPTMSVDAIIYIPVDNDGLFSEIDTGVYEKFVVDEFVSTFSPIQDLTEMQCRRVIDG